MTAVEYLIKWIKRAGAETEAQSKRNGFLSYHAETHAVGMGIAAGFIAVASGQSKLLGLVYGASVYGKASGTSKRRRILLDMKQEPHYALGGVVMGAMLGLLVRVVTGKLAIPV